MLLTDINFPGCLVPPHRLEQWSERSLIHPRPNHPGELMLQVEMEMDEHMELLREGSHMASVDRKGSWRLVTSSLRAVICKKEYNFVLDLSLSAALGTLLHKDKWVHRTWCGDGAQYQWHERCLAIVSVRKSANVAFQESAPQQVLLRITLLPLSFDFALEIREIISRTVSERRTRWDCFCTGSVEGAIRRMISGFRGVLMMVFCCGWCWLRRAIHGRAKTQNIKLLLRIRRKQRTLRGKSLSGNDMRACG